VQIVLATVAAAIGLGWAVDLITAHVAVEYFTVHHPRVIASDSPWVMAFYWGFAATWWAGLIAGVILAWANNHRAEPKSAWSVIRQVLIGALLAWLAMLLLLVAVYAFAGTIPVQSRRPSFESDRRLMAVAMAHQIEYVLAAVITTAIARRIGKAL
jgi:hypothetical protein